jgi:hypothetical protein
MAISFHCQCGRHYKVDEGMAGKKAKCKSCGQQIQVPHVPLETLETLEPLAPLNDASADDVLTDVAAMIPATSVAQFQQSQQQLHVPKKEPSRPKFNLPTIDITICGLSFYQLLTLFGFLVAFLAIVYYFTPGTGARPYYTAEAFDEGTRRVDLGTVSRGWIVKIYGAPDGPIEERVVTEYFVGGMKTREHVVLDEVSVTGPDSGVSESHSSGRLRAQGQDALVVGFQFAQEQGNVEVTETTTTTADGDGASPGSQAEPAATPGSYEIHWARNHRGLKVTLDGRRIPQAFWNVFQ